MGRVSVQYLIRCIAAARCKFAEKSVHPIYLDYNATTPVAPEVARAMAPFLGGLYGNPSSNHWYGLQARQAVETARAGVASLIGCHADEICFTAGGTESNNMAIKGIALSKQGAGNHIITSSIEHPAVLEVCHWLEKHGFRITRLRVDGYGCVDPDDLRKAITPDTILISIMHSNNETGTLQPIREIGEIAAGHGIDFHTDAAQSTGKIPVDVRQTGISLLTVAGHKLYAPKGIGALYIRRGVSLEQITHGAGQERGLRPGTENVMFMAGLGEACRIAQDSILINPVDMHVLRDRLEAGILGGVSRARVNGHPKHRLPNTLSISFRDVEAQTLLSELGGIAASAGAACHSGRVDMGHVLTAMGVSPVWGMGTIRFSTGRFTTAEEIDLAIGMITEAVNRLQGSTTCPVVENHGEIRLTHFTHGLGCACKLRPRQLEEVLKTLPRPSAPEILVGTETSDDASVYRISENLALVSTLDFFTPVVDDPYTFGAVAAANSLSDIYAMGAKPLYALNIAAFPSNRLPASVLAAILKGAADKAAEAGIPVLGGHTVEDNEPKFGLSVTGSVHPAKILRNSGAQPGHALVLTKPLGTGILSTALKQGLLDHIQKKALHESLLKLNRDAAEIMAAYPVSACTDVTGFGLLGHLCEMCRPSNLGFELNANAVELLPGVAGFSSLGIIPGGSRDNLEYVSGEVDFQPGFPLHLQLILADAQTNGGLLIALPAEAAAGLVDELRRNGSPHAVLIGQFSNSGRVVVQSNV